MVHNPFTSRMCCSEIRKGYVEGRRSDSRIGQPLEDCIFSIMWYCYEKSLAPGVFRATESLYLRINDIRRIGTTVVELSMLIESDVDLYFEIRLSPWDYAGVMTCMLAASRICWRIDKRVALDHSSLVLVTNTEENQDVLLDAVHKGFHNGAPYDMSGSVFRIPSVVNSL